MYYVKIRRNVGGCLVSNVVDFESQHKLVLFFAKINLKKVLHKSNIVCTFVMLSATKLKRKTFKTMNYLSNRPINVSNYESSSSDFINTAGIAVNLSSVVFGQIEISKTPSTPLMPVGFYKRNNEWYKVIDTYNSEKMSKIQSDEIECLILEAKKFINEEYKLIGNAYKYVYSIKNI